MKICKKHATVLTAFLMFVSMAFLVSLIPTYIHVGSPLTFYKNG